ncbi:MAG: cytochrome P450 [Flavobacteriaceae bacterium]|nr:cytochrome P450 [Flavobacteriaceae bacterium]
MSKYIFPNRVPFSKFLIQSAAIAKNPIPYHKKWFDLYNDSFSVKPWFQNTVMLTRDAEHSKHILQKHHKLYQKSKIQTKFLSKYVGYGLLTSNGDYWLQQRRLIQPGFHKEKIKNLVDIINASIVEQVSKIETGKTIPLYPLMNELAFKVVAKSLFNFSAEGQTLNRLQFIIEELQKFIVKEIRQPHKKLWLYLNGSIKYHMALVMESRTIIESIINQRRQTEAEHDDLLQMLLEAQYEDGSSMTNTQLIDEILILFVAGHETTANALTFTLTLLAQNPKILKKVEAEINAVRTKNLGPLESIPQLSYVKNCIDESLRLYPPAWITDREALADDRLGDYFIKKGTMIGISIFELHRNKSFWNQPEAFIPERFSENPNLHKSEFYIPFGAGPRLCIGNNFAIYEMVLTIFEIIKRFDISTTTSEINYNPLITLKPVGSEMKFSSKAK